MKHRAQSITTVLLFTVIVSILIYTRFVNLSWGLPYPMHPDERNMSVALQQLQCNEFPISNFQFPNELLNSLKNCFSPHFFAYGQLPLYLGYVLIILGRLGGFWLFGRPGMLISFEEATMSLRILSATASVLNVFVLLKIIILLISNFKFLIPNQTLKSKFLISNNFIIPFSLLLITFIPGFIQFAHFGTTESLLMLFYSSIIYLSLITIRQFNKKTILYLGIISGLSLATKASSLLFLFVPFVVICYRRRQDLRKLIWEIGVFGVITGIVTVFCSPHNLISFSDFISSMKYESAVGLGTFPAFYTRGFIGTIPVLFQLTHIFPYALGWPVFILGMLGMLGLSWKSKEINLLRFAFFAYFLPNAFVFTKWTRFMAPVLPLIVIFAVLFLYKVTEKIYKVRKTYFLVLCFMFYVLCLLPGIAYLSVYQHQDVRLTASEWIFKNIPEGSYILSETANVIDIPVATSNVKRSTLNYKYNSFNFYDVDEDPFLQYELKEHIAKADYIIVPSRRVFMNLKEKYPILNEYYRKLFNGELGFKQVAEFSSFSRFTFHVSRFTFDWVFNDESAEETWTVFDHPVIRIYKKSK